MKVLVVSDVLGEENNGTTIAGMNLIRHLKSQGDEVRVLCCDQDKKGLPGYFIVPNRHFIKPIDYIIEKNNVTLAKPIKSIIEEAMDGVDIVHALFPFALCSCTAKLASQKGIPVTGSFHCQAENVSAHLGTMNVRLVNRLLYKRFYKKFYQYCHAIHYPTQFIKDTFEKAIKKKTNGYVISNGVQEIYKKEKAFAQENKDTIDILFIGRVSKEKSHHLLVEAVSKSKYKDKIQLHFAGQGPREKEVLNKAKKLGIKIPIIKFMSRQDLVTLINSCDLYVHASEIEIEAISCLEAISCGLVPIINDSDRSATRAFAIDENNLFKFNDTTDLKDKIEYWIDNPDKKQQRSNEYLELRKKFQYDFCMKEMRKMLLTYVKADNKDIRFPQRCIYYKDALVDDFANTNIKTKLTKDDFKYTTRNPVFNGVGFFLYYAIAKPLILLINKITNHNKIVNKRVLKKCKNKGYYIYANHTSFLADAFTPNSLSLKKNYIIVNPDATSIPGIKNLVMMFGAIPLPSSPISTKNYIATLNQRIKENKSITIYPEAHIWPYMTDIRPFKEDSFIYPFNNNTPAYCLTNTWHKRKHSSKPKLVTYVDGPFMINPELNKHDAIVDLRNQIYETMVKRSKQTQQYQYKKYICIKDSSQ